jgi:hypothetical protein
LLLQDVANEGGRRQFFGIDEIVVAAPLPECSIPANIFRYDRVVGFLPQGNLDRPPGNTEDIAQAGYSRHTRSDLNSFAEAPL